MPRIYLLSRPGDATDLSDLLAELLGARYGVKNVVRGSVGRTVEEYSQQAERDIRACDIALVVMGPYWLHTRDQAGQSLLGHAYDPVLIALRLALTMRKFIAPILSDGVSMPSPAELPSDLQRLTQFQAFPVRSAPFFTDDVKALVQQINTKLTWRPANIFLVACSSLTFFCCAALLSITLAVRFGANVSDALAALALLDMLAIASLFPILAVTSVIIAVRRGSRRWLWTLAGMFLLAIASFANVYTYLLVLTYSQQHAYPIALFFAALVALSVSALVFLGFALFGPRREAAYT
jgi:hypothetical protein